MKIKVLNMCLITACAVLLFFIPGKSIVYARAQSDTTQQINLSQVEIVARRQEVYSALARVVTVVTKEEIQNAPVKTLSDLLRYIPGVDIRQRGANGVQADINMRGGTFEQMLVLLNGINITDPQTGHYALDIPVDLSSIDRIEVLQGPGSRELGPNAFSGAVNIITGSSETNRVGVGISGGSYGFLSQEAGGTLVSGPVTAFASASHSRSEGYMEDTDFGITNVFGQVKMRTGQSGRINLQGGFQDKDYGAYGFYSLNPLYANEYEATKTFFGSASFSTTIKRLSVETKVYWRRHHDRFELFRDYRGAYPGYTHNYHLTQVAGVSQTVSLVSFLGKTTMGVDYRNEHIFSNALGEVMADGVPVPFEPDSIFFTRDKRRQNVNGFVSHALYFNKFSASVGVLGNYCDHFGSNFYFGADLGYAFNSYWSLYASVNQSLRLPTFTDLYLNNATQEGNPNLKPEKAITYEAGVKYRHHRWNAGVLGYYRMGRDIIDWVKYSSSDVRFTAVNHARINALGTEMFLEYLSRTMLQRIKLAYSFLTQDKTSEEYDSKYALDYLKHKLTLNIDHIIYKEFSASWRLSFSDRAGNFTNASNLPENYRPFFLTDLRVQWQKGGVTIFCDVNNLFNTSYADYGGIIQPGIWIKSGIKIVYLPQI